MARFPKGRDASGTPTSQWLAEQFEYEYCAECSGDACHHTAVPVMGNWFARCDFAPAEDDVATPHPVIRQYRENMGAPWVPPARASGHQG